jgi:RHS repeat-associated protein
LDGEIVQHVEYVPFGEVFIEERNNVWNTPYLFNAKELDEETGLYYYGARYYDARISLWLSADPMQEKYPNISTYAYTFQNPIRYIDPRGMEGEDGGFIEILKRLFFGDQRGEELTPKHRKNGVELAKYQLQELEQGAQRARQTGDYLQSLAEGMSAVHPLGGVIYASGKVYTGQELEPGDVLSASLDVLPYVGKIGKVGGSIWKLAKFERGFKYEKILNLKGTFKIHNFPTIDAFADGIATSIKTMDVTAKSYQKGNSVYNKLMSYVNKLVNFKGARWSGIVVEEGQVNKRVLEIGMPQGATKSQLEQITKAINDAKSKGIEMNVRIIE